ncbi:MAG: hypothetical protein R2850_04815 [Bacteroidia bacterium]
MEKQIRVFGIVFKKVESKISLQNQNKIMYETMDPSIRGSRIDCIEKINLEYKRSFELPACVISGSDSNDEKYYIKP